MRLSTKGRYALEALVLLGYNSHDDMPISLKRISNEADISEGYLEQLFSKLKKENIIESKKGKNGGYRFAKPTHNISVGDILRAVEGSLSPVKCLDHVHCKREENCVTRHVWMSAFEKINNVVDNISLETLVDDYLVRLSQGSIS